MGIEHSYGSNMSNVEHLVDKEAYHIAKKSEPFILHNENRSGEQDAMKEVSGTSGVGLFPAIGIAVDKTIKGAWRITKKTAGLFGKGVEGGYKKMKKILPIGPAVDKTIKKAWHITKKTAGVVGKGVEKIWQIKKKTAGLVGK